MTLIRILWTSEINATIVIEKELNLEESDVPEPFKTFIYRILQEALNHIAKHGAVHHVRLYPGKERGMVVLVVTGDGGGLNLEEVLAADKETRGFGIAGMRERIELSGGTFAIHTNQNAGTRVQASWLA